MTAANLSVVFAPCVIKPEIDDPALLVGTAINRAAAVEDMIENFSEVFAPPDGHCSQSFPVLRGISSQGQVPAESNVPAHSNSSEALDVRTEATDSADGMANGPRHCRPLARPHCERRTPLMEPIASLTVANDDDDDDGERASLSDKDTVEPDGPLAAENDEAVEVSCLDPRASLVLANGDKTLNSSDPIDYVGSLAAAIISDSSIREHCCPTELTDVASGHCEHCLRPVLVSSGNRHCPACLVTTDVGGQPDHCTKPAAADVAGPQHQGVRSLEQQLQTERRLVHQLRKQLSDATAQNSLLTSRLSEATKQVEMLTSQLAEERLATSAAVTRVVDLQTKLQRYNVKFGSVGDD